MKLISVDADQHSVYEELILNMVSLFIYFGLFIFSFCDLRLTRTRRDTSMFSLDFLSRRDIFS